MLTGSKNSEFFRRLKMLNFAMIIIFLTIRYNGCDGPLEIKSHTYARNGRNLGGGGVSQESSRAHFLQNHLRRRKT